MLVLGRFRDEEIVISDREGQELVRVLVVAVCGGKVKLGITAPTECAVHRREVWDAIQRKKAKE